MTPEEVVGANSYQFCRRHAATPIPNRQPTHQATAPTHIELHTATHGAIVHDTNCQHQTCTTVLIKYLPYALPLTYNCINAANEASDITASCVQRCRHRNPSHPAAAHAAAAPLPRPRHAKAAQAARPAAAEAATAAPCHAATEPKPARQPSRQPSTRQHHAATDGGESVVVWRCVRVVIQVCCTCAGDGAGTGVRWAMREGAAMAGRQAGRQAGRDTGPPRSTRVPHGNPPHADRQGCTGALAPAPLTHLPVLPPRPPPPMVPGGMKGGRASGASGGGPHPGTAGRNCCLRGAYAQRRARV